MHKVHTDRAYEAELQQVRENLLKMAGLVEQMIDTAVISLMGRDIKGATDTIAEDAKVNRIEVDTDELCLLILAKRQPLASDLRFITLAMKMVTDLERIGDLAVNICERTQELGELDVEPISQRIPVMSKAVQRMVRDAIDAFVERDADKAYEVFEIDNDVDELYLEVCSAQQSRIHANPEHVARGIHIQAVAKFLERIGDHATNLAELVVFMIRGKDIRHLGKLTDVQ